MLKIIVSTFLYSLFLLQTFNACAIECNNNKVRILSINGGGVRGIIPSIVLTDIESKLNGKSIAESFDIITGTSTGAIIALALNVPDPNNKNKPKYKSNDIVNLYKDFNSNVFDTTFRRKFFSMNGWLSYKYNSKPLNKLLKKYLGETKISESISNLVIPAYDVKNNKTEIFNTRQARLFPEKHDYRMWEVALAATAAPTYFKSFKINNREFIDGGLTMNNPTLASMIHAFMLCGRRVDFFILSIGTGRTKIENLVGSSGKLGWLKHILNITIDGVSQLNHKQVQLVISELNKDRKDNKYVYLDIVIDKENELLDNTSTQNIQKLEEYGNYLIKKESQEIKNIVSIIMKSYSLLEQE
ncbi:MAG TPA: patatin-like phospholipase family protein [Flavobacteriaceae bacterium]